MRGVALGAVYEHHCDEGDRRGRAHSRRLGQWGKAQARWLPGNMPYEAARRRARLAAETLESLCDYCPYAGQEEETPCSQ